MMMVMMIVMRMCVVMPRVVLPQQIPPVIIAIRRAHHCVDMVA